MVPLKHRVNFFFADFGISLLDYYKIANEVVDWVNKCFDKNTNRYFFLGISKFKITDYPHSGSCLDLPTKNFDINVYFVPFKNGDPDGFCLFNEKGAGIAVIPIIPQSFHKNLDLVIKNNVLHEFGHIFGMAFGEYYNIKMIKDFTLVEPELKVNMLLANDHYWSSPIRKAWKNDVMLNTRAPDPCWSPLSMLMANYCYWRVSGPPIPQETMVKSDFPRTRIQIYRMCRAGYDLMSEGITLEDGSFLFDWGTDMNNATSNDQFRKIIFDTDNGKIARGLSIFDVQQAWLLECDKLDCLSPSPPHISYRALI